MFSDLHFKETRLLTISYKEFLKNDNNKKTGGQMGCYVMVTNLFLAKLESFAWNGQVEVQQGNLNKCSRT